MSDSSDSSNSISDSIQSLQELPNWGSREETGLLIVVVLSLFIYLVYAIFTEFRFELISFGGIGTILLAFLYWRQQRVLDEQTEIQNRQTQTLENQEELMEINQAPIVVLENIEASNNSVILHLSNVGRGTATNMSVFFTYIPIESTSGEPDLSYVSKTAPASLTPVMRVPTELPGGPNIQPNEFNQQFLAEAEFRNPDMQDLEITKPEGSMLKMDELSEILLDYGYSTITFQMVVLYDYPPPSKRSMQYGTSVRAVELEKGMDFEQAWNKAMRAPAVGDIYHTSLTEYRPFLLHRSWMEKRWSAYED